MTEQRPTDLMQALEIAFRDVREGRSLFDTWKVRAWAKPRVCLNPRHYPTPEAPNALTADPRIHWKDETPCA